MTPFRTTLEDMIDAQELWARQHRRLAAWKIAGLTAMGAGAAFLIAALEGAWIEGAIAAAFIGAVIPPIWIFGIIPLDRRRASRAQLRTNPMIQGDLRFTFDEDGIVSEAAVGTGRMNWTAMSGWAEGPRMFVVFFGPQQFYFFPKRSMTEPEVENVRGLLGRKIRQRH